MIVNNMLIITNDFPNKDNTYTVNIFIKEQLNDLKNFVDNIYVIVPLPVGIEYIRKTKYTKYQFDNVTVVFLRYYNFPLFYFWLRDAWIELEKRAVLKYINNIGIKYDLIHAHYTWPSGATAVAIKEQLNVPVVITEHTSTTLFNAIQKKDIIYKRTLGQCDSIIRVRKSDIKLFSGVGIDIKKIHYVPNGYDTNKFFYMDSRFCREKLELPLGKKIILNVANMYSGVKGHKYLISAMSEIVKQRNDVLCIIVGSGKLKNDLKQQIVNAGLEDYVKLVGSKPHDEVPLWMNACDIFVMPSLRESFGVVQIEAMACGKPIIATYNGGSEEIITSTDYGLLCKPEDSIGLCENIMLALNTKWNGMKIIKYARNFTWNEIAYSIMKIYKNLLNQL
jgi:glycosyltransferase involved in cell wall biosynthesis